MTRAILRYVPHTIRHQEEGGWIYEAFCAAPDCKEGSGPPRHPRGSAGLGASAHRPEPYA
jgi:hypothetical protein